MAVCRKQHKHKKTLKYGSGSQTWRTILESLFVCFPSVPMPGSLKQGFLIGLKSDWGVGCLDSPQ